MSLDLKGGTGGITAMCSCDDFLEIYKEDTTFRVKTPETIDPHRTNPNAPFVVEIADTVGSSNPAVARIVLQGQDFLQSAIFDGNVDKNATLRILHACKKSIVVCHKIAERVSAHVNRVVHECKATGVARDGEGRAHNPFPQVPDLEADTVGFLINAKRAIQDVCRLPSMFLDIKGKDNNFDALSRTLYSIVGSSSPVTEFVRANAAGVRHLIELRNFQEHPDDRRTIVENFSVMADGSISLPMWNVLGERPRPIAAEMTAAVAFLIEITEAMLIHLVMAKIDKRIPYVVEEIDDAQINPKTPIKYRLSVDPTRLGPNDRRST